MKKINHHTINGIINCLSGMRIGGSDELLEIGGTDLSCIKHPVTLQPYIPGSSLKGKMRSELEKKLGLIYEYEKKGKKFGEPTHSPDNLVGRIFGAHKNPSGKNGPSRIIVRDAKLMEGGETELKTENTINRKSGGAFNPRKMERVASGSKFSLKIGLQVLDIDEKQRYNSKQGGEAFIEFVMEGLREVQNTGLGSGVSRGSGEVEFIDLKVDGHPYSL